MKKIAAALFVAISMAVVALPASADPVTTYTVTINSAGPQSEAGVYVYPYNFTVTENTPGSTAQSIAMMCMDFDREVNPPETWTADLVNITSTPLPTDTPLLTSTDLKELAVLYSEILDAPVSSQALADLQFAAWSINATTYDMTNGPYAAGFTTGASNDLAAAVSAVNGGSTSGARNSNGDAVTYADYSYFNPVADPGPGGPQRFLFYNPPGAPFNPHAGPSPVPEPSSLALLGTGVLGLASFARRRMLKA